MTTNFGPSWVEIDSIRVPLTRAELEICKRMAAGAGEVVSQYDLYTAWRPGVKYGDFGGSIRTIIKRTRHKFEARQIDPETIVAVHGHGYRWTNPLAREESAWRAIDGAPAPLGYIDNYPSFYSEGPHTYVRYAADEGEAICLIRGRIDLEKQQWVALAWAPIPAALRGP